ncbi:hypothetical protein BFC18_19935 [Alteromonas confluentis]|uniref:Uncharacterized protein n=1 Tax=Alteromonas confluentis TaxID=1656094 RepID=A0A1E7Z6A9_9ALTE|nr:hypothetical protein BFC18_19935 [Alteromonas confluentis]
MERNTNIGCVGFRDKGKGITARVAAGTTSRNEEYHRIVVLRKRTVQGLHVKDNSTERRIPLQG